MSNLRQLHWFCMLIKCEREKKKSNRKLTVVLFIYPCMSLTFYDRDSVHSRPTACRNARYEMKGNTQSAENNNKFRSEKSVDEKLYIRSMWQRLISGVVRIFIQLLQLLGCWWKTDGSWKHRHRSRYYWWDGIFQIFWSFDPHDMWQI